MKARALIAVGLLALAACTHDRPHGHLTDRFGGTPAISGNFYLSSSFEQPVCGNYHHPDPGCEFGTQGDVQTGAFGCRTGPGCLQIQRDSNSHMGAIKDVPVDNGHAFVGCAFRVPAIPPAADGAGFVQLMQITPSDGNQVTQPVEVRFHDDRTIGLALFTGKDETRSTWTAPVDQWFYVVVEMQNGVDVTNRIWIYGPDDTEVFHGEIALTTAIGHRTEPRDKIGGTNDTVSPAFTYADDWYIADANLGPLHIRPEPSVSPS